MPWYYCTTLHDDVLITKGHNKYEYDAVMTTLNDYIEVFEFLSHVTSCQMDILEKWYIATRYTFYDCDKENDSMFLTLSKAGRLIYSNKQQGISHNSATLLSCIVLGHLRAQ